MQDWLPYQGTGEGWCLDTRRFSVHLPSVLPAELQSYLKGASRDLRNEVTSWAGSALSSFNSALQQRTGKSLQDYGVDPDAIGKQGCNTLMQRVERGWEGNAVELRVVLTERGVQRPLVRLRTKTRLRLTLPSASSTREGAWISCFRLVPDPESIPIHPLDAAVL